jgi:outer membrane protein OmpA-like peptidoglycan-associated protein
MGLMCLPVYTSAQEDEKKEAEKKVVEKKGRENLVDNGDFSEFEGSLRRKEQFELAKGWVNPTATKSELYATDVKSRYIAIPDNMYGHQEPAVGDNYAGLTAYGYRNKMNRSYIQAPLKQSLQERGLYCVKFKASLAERSRYASNNLSVSLDKSSLSSKGTTSLSASNPLYSDYNDVVDIRDGWWEFCALYRAAGKEKYITIGNFQSDDRTKTVQMDLPEKYEEDGPIMGAYYYIDDVRVEPIAVGESCNCASERIPESKVIFSGSVQLTDEMSLADKIQAIDAYFYQYQAEVVSAAERTIDQIVELLKANPSAQVTIIGHSDNEEAELAKSEATLMGLAMRRANLVRNYMMEQGIGEDRLSVKSMDNNAPVAKMATPISLAKNRRVEFELK